MTLEELKGRVIERAKAVGHYNANGEDLAMLIDRVEEVVREMRDSCDIYQGHIGMATRLEGMEDRVTEWVDKLEGK